MASTMDDINANGATNNEVNQLYNNGRSSRSGRTDTQILESIEQQLSRLIQSGGNINNMSASNARNQYGGRQGSTFYRDLSSGRISRTGRIGNYRDFAQNFEKELFDNLFGNEFKNALRDIRDKLAKDLGVEIGDLPKELGKLAGRQLSNTLKNTTLGRAILDPINNYTRNLGNRLREAYERGSAPYRNNNRVVDRLTQNNASDAVRNALNRQNRGASDVYNNGRRTGTADMPDLEDTIVNGASRIMNRVSDSAADEALREGAQGQLTSTIRNLGQASAGTEGALGGLSEVISTVVNPEMIAAGAATMGLVVALDVGVSFIKKQLKPAMDEFKKVVEKASAALNRYQASRDKDLELSRTRLEADIKSMVETPFKILEDAAQRWYETWDSTLRSISATQGYTKEQVQQLYGSFVERLKTEGLTEVVGANDIVNNLANVLSTGLQGAAAEEFAYIATKLNAAIPTQDFFQYAQTYQLVASNAISQGKSLEEALALANAELESFANSVLYAGRELSSGFATGLKGAETLFQKAEQIAQAGRYESGAQLGASLTSIAAITGAVAPDLSSAIVDALYKASVGGNASELVALRSLAGINASNTEFLNSLMQNPQQVLGDLFDKLNQYQNMASGAYMEVAEGLSSIFGISSEALARVDFGQVANAVRASANPSNALEQNMKLLVSGQTTTTAEMQRIYEANKYMMDEGLAYVLDNEVTREIQKHMWDEQIAQDLMETTYGVELTGEALMFLEKLAGGINNIINIVNPRAWGNKISELTVSAETESALKSDLAQIVQLGRVGAGNAEAYRWLTTYGERLGVSGNYLELLGGTASYRETLKSIDEIRNNSGGLSTLGAAGFTGYDNDRIKRNILGNVANNLQAANTITGWISKFFDYDEIESNGSGHERGSSLADATVGELYGVEANKNAREREKILAEINANLENELSSIKNGPSSMYNWTMVGKSALGRLGGGIYDYNTGETVIAASALANTAQSQSVLTTNLQKMLDSMEEFYTEDNTRTYADFVATAKQYGIADFEQALEKGGLTTAAVENKYQELQVQAGVKQKAQRESTEEKFWEDSILELTTSHSLLDQINTTATNIYNIFDGFISAWKDYFIEHTVYNNAYTRDAVQKVLNEERDSSETAIYALADALTQNDIGLLMDPTLQTNALLAQILKVANAILNQQGTGAGGLSLPDTLAGLSLGIIET